MPDQPARPVPTGEAAKQLGVHRGTLQRWWRQGSVRPAYVTPGGQARWDMADLRKQLLEWRESLAEDDETPDQ